MSMNWADMMNQFQGQGSIFWVAAASIAGGATLLLVSGLVLARRGLIRGLLMVWRKPRPAVELTDTGYKANTLTKAVPASQPAPGADKQALAELYRRLQAAANNLEEINQSLRNSPNLPGVSGLKAPLRDVEYVFKSGIS